MDEELNELLATDLSSIERTDLTDLRTTRTACDQVEDDVSFVRRLAQGRLDIVGHEVQNRKGVTTTSSLNDVLFEMPSILSDQPTSSPSGSRPVAVNEPGPTAMKLLTKLDGIAPMSKLRNLTTLDQFELLALVEDVQLFERDLSTSRRRLHQIIDKIQNEIARRYRDGEASVDALLQ